MSGRSQGSIQVTVAGMSDRGRRRADNQDSLLIADLSAVDALFDPEGADASAQVAQFAIGARGAVLFVADGMGGAAAGATASRMAVTLVRDDLADTTDDVPTAQQFTTRLKRSLERANTRIYEHAQRERACAGMGTTATVAGILDDHVYCAQVGDSRAYVIRGDVAIQLTRDQSVVQDFIDAGIMTEAAAEGSVHSNKILQAVGALPAIDVVLTYQRVCQGDVLLLCSDGLTRVVSREEIAAYTLRAESPAELCRALIALANERGGPDNVTVIAARFDGDGLSPPAIGDVVARTNYTGGRAELPC